MAGQSKNITLYIFLFALFITISMILGARTYNLYASSKTSTDKTIKSTMQCAFSYTITNIRYTEGSLGFDIKTSDKDLLKTLIVVGNNDIKSIQLAEFIEPRQNVNVGPISMGDAFTVYPAGCEESNKKLCSLSVGRCEG